MLKLPASVRLESAPIPHLVVKNGLGEAVVCLQGAQVMHFALASGQPLLWAADKKHWVAGKNLRGGVPVCWPWFGPHHADKSLPQHGWVRQRPWQLIEACDLPDGRTQLAFTIVPEKELADWPQTLLVSLEVTVGATLTLALTSANFGETPVRVEDALHAYFAVSDVRNIAVHGLGGARYVDQFDGMRAKIQAAGEVKLSEPTCRTYFGASSACAIADPAMNRRIAITQAHAGASVLWNPWPTIAATMPDLGENWPQMVCLEAANCMEAALTLAPGQTHTTGVVYGVGAAA